MALFRGVSRRGGQNFCILWKRERKRDRERTRETERENKGVHTVLGFEWRREREERDIEGNSEELKERARREMQIKRKTTMKNKTHTHSVKK